MGTQWRPARGPNDAMLMTRWRELAKVDAKEDGLSAAITIVETHSDQVTGFGWVLRSCLALNYPIYGGDSFAFQKSEPLNRYVICLYAFFENLLSKKKHTF
jgi:hypothetical protein